MMNKRETKVEREWRERSWPRTAVYSEHSGVAVHVHKRILENFMRKAGKRIVIESTKVVGPIGNFPGGYEIEYRTRHGGLGKLMLYDLGPMPGDVG